MTRSHEVYRRAFVPGVVVLLWAASGCSGTHAEDATAAAAEAVEPASSATDAPELAGLLDGLTGAPDRDAVEGFRCDATPEITNVTVCDKQFPSTIHLEWTACALGGMPPPPPPPDGGSLPPPPPPPPPGGRLDGTSAGSVDVTMQVALDPSTACGAGEKFQVQESTTFQVQRSAPDGRSASASGTTTSTAELGPTGPETKTTQLDVTRTFADGSGDARSMHLTGQISVVFDASSGAVVRTIAGDLQAELSDGTTSTVQLVDLVRPAPWVCRWPTSGSVIRTGADGTAHTLVYGPTCGQASLDGADLSLQGPPGGGGCGGLPPPPPPDGGLLPPPR